THRRRRHCALARARAGSGGSAGAGGARRASEALARAAARRRGGNRDPGGRTKGPHSWRLPFGPSAAHPRRLGGDGFRGRADTTPRGAAAEGVAAARRGRDAEVVRLRGGDAAAAAVGSGSPGGVPRGIRTDQRGRSRAVLRDREGSLRAALRDQPPARLGWDSPARAEAFNLAAARSTW